MRTGDDWSECHAALQRVCDIFNTKMGQRAKAAITETDSGAGSAAVVVAYLGTTQSETALERRERQDLVVGFGAAGFVAHTLEGSPDHLAWRLELAATSDLAPSPTTE